MSESLRILAGLALTVTWWPGAALAEGDTPYLATIAIERAAGANGVLGELVVSTLHVNEPQKTAVMLAQVDGMEITATSDSTVSIRAAARPTLREAPTSRHRDNTWVVDFDEDAIQALLAQLAAESDAAPSPADLEQFVFKHIINKSYSRAFDLASRVAATQEGDCTEHAVLLAALARAHGYPARVVFGNLVLDLDEGLFAFGHAWAEIYVGDAWQIRDATMPDNDPSLRQVRYLPAGDLREEGPAYFMGLVETMATMPTRISNVGRSP
jgi:transglutaminase-like putative cysteine protease